MSDKPSLHMTLDSLPVWRLIVALDDAERTAGPESPEVLALARHLRERLRSNYCDRAAPSHESIYSVHSWPVIIRKAFKKNNISTLADLCRLSADDVLEWVNIGHTSLWNIRRALAGRDLALRGETAEWVKAEDAATSACVNASMAAAKAVDEAGQ